MACLEPIPTLCVAQGGDLTIAINVADENGGVIDLTGATAWFTLEAYDPVFPSRASITIKKKSTNASQIQIVAPMTGTNQTKYWQVQIFLTSSDTLSLPVSEGTNAKYDAWVETSSGKRYQIAAPSELEIHSSVTTSFA